MANFIQYHILILIVFFSYRFFLRKQTHLRTSRIFLLTGILFSLVLTFLDSGLIFVNKEQFLFINTLQPILVQATEIASSNEFNFYTLLRGIYLSGLIFFSLRFCFSLYAIWNLKSQSINKGAYLEVKESTVAFSFMNLIFLGDTIPKAEKEILLKHEQIHIQQFHSIDIIICHFLEILFWFNPLIFRFKYFFEEIHEFEADALSCENETQYLNLLLNQNLNQFHFSLIHQFNANHLKNRIMRIKNKPQVKVNLWGLCLAMCLFAITFIVNEQLFANNNESIPLNELTEKAEGNKVDKKAEFRGGYPALVEYIGSVVKYPKSIKEDKEGMVFIKFKVNADGTTSNFTVEKSTDKVFNDAALAIQDEMPNWTPAEKKGKKVASMVTLPIKFKPNPSATLAPPPPPPPPAPPVKTN